MAWVKRGGGRGTGIYGGGLPAVDNPAKRQGPPSPSAISSTADARRGAGQQPSEPAPAPAYRPTRWEEVRNNRIILDVLAKWVAEGNEAATSMLFDDAVAAFGTKSPHLMAACAGQIGAGVNYQQSVAGGRYRDER